MGTHQVDDEEDTNGREGDGAETSDGAEGVYSSLRACKYSLHCRAQLRYAMAGVRGHGDCTKKIGFAQHMLTVAFTPQSAA